MLGVSAASLGDSPVGRQVLDHLAPRVTKAWVDGGYNAKVVEHGADLGIDVEIVRRDYETRQESSRAMIHWSIIGIMSRALTGNSTPTWQQPRPT